MDKAVHLQGRVVRLDKKVRLNYIPFMKGAVQI